MNMVSAPSLLRLLAVVVLPFLAPQSLFACAACFGAPGSALSRGFFWGMLTLLSLPFLLTATIVFLIMRASRRTIPAEPA